MSKPIPQSAANLAFSRAIRTLPACSGIALLMAIAVLSLQLSPSFSAEDEKTGAVNDYDQWKQALNASQATDPKQIHAPPGFVVELLRSASTEEGSWISLVFDPQGRIIIAKESRGLLRLTLATPHAAPAGHDSPPKKSPPAETFARVETINDSLLECRGLLWAHDSLYVNANNSKGLYRLKYDSAADALSEPILLRETPGGVGHGRNDLALGPDGMIYTIHGDDVSLPQDYQIEKSPLQNYSDDRIIPCSWDQELFNASMKLPGGHLARTDPDGKTWEVVAGGLRNPYGIDFNPEGELFTYDADMEWDVGMPWYRPTRVLHLVSGADFGWRKGTGTWRSWYPDSLPAAADIGLGSPTAVKFGTRSDFPERYRQSLFILDWAYGRILAVDLTPTGATYRAESETFVSGRPLNVTDLDFGPDGCMYFLTGGRKTQSGLYRVRYVGGNQSAGKKGGSASDAAAEVARKTRRELEKLHHPAAGDAIDAAWLHLANGDPWIGHAARVAIELQPLTLWRERAFQETDARSASVALLAMARVGNRDDRDRLAEKVLSLPWNSLDSQQRIVVARTLAIDIARFGLPSKRDEIVAAIDARYPDPSVEVNQLLCELLVALNGPVIEKTLPLITTAKTQEEKIHYLVTLRHVKSGWTPALRRSYVEWLKESRNFYGAHYLNRYVAWLKRDVAETFSADEKQQFADFLVEPAAPSLSTPAINRPYVRNWQLDDLAGSLTWNRPERNIRRGEEIFAAALCDRCHRMGSRGSPIGPDLTQVSRRFGRRDILLSVLFPSHVIDEKYRSTTVVTNEGKVVVGQVMASENEITVLPDQLSPEAVIKVRAADIESQTPSLVSPMPAGLLNSFTKEEILDLLAYLEEPVGDQ